MRQTLFRGSDDGFTVIGAIILILVFLLILPVLARKADAEYMKAYQQYEEEAGETY